MPKYRREKNGKSGLQATGGIVIYRERETPRELREERKRMGTMQLQRGRGVGKERARRGGMRGPDGRCIASPKCVPERIGLGLEGGSMWVRGSNMSHVVR